MTPTRSILRRIVALSLMPKGTAQSVYVVCRPDSVVVLEGPFQVREVAEAIKQRMERERFGSQLRVLRCYVGKDPLIKWL